MSMCQKGRYPSDLHKIEKIFAPIDYLLQNFSCFKTCFSILKRFDIHQNQMNPVMKENGHKKHCFNSPYDFAVYSPKSSLLLTKKKLLLVAAISFVMLPFSHANVTPAVNSNPVINSASTGAKSEERIPESLFGVGKTTRRNSEDTAAFIVKANEEDVEIMKSVERKELEIEDNDLRGHSKIDSELTFHIENTMPFDSSGDAFCVQVNSFEEDAEIKMRACDSANHKQMWFMDYYGQLRLRFNDEMCLIWKGRNLKMSSKCKKKKSPSTKSSKSKMEDATYRFFIDEEDNQISADRKDSLELTHLGVPRKQLLKAMRLFHPNPTNVNESINKFQLKWIISDASQTPSQVPSTSMNPSPAPSSVPSETPSECVDEEGWTVGGDSEFQNMTCAHIDGDPEKWCDLLQGISSTQNLSKSISEACCLCHGSTFKTTYPSTTPSSKPSTSQLPTLHEYPSSEPSSQPSICRDEPNWHFKTEKDDGTVVQVSCAMFGDNDELCEQFKDFEYEAKTPALACCICGGGDHQSVAPSSSPSSLPTSEPSFQPSVSSKPTDQPSDIPSDSPSDVPSTIPSSTPSDSMQPSGFPSMQFGATFDGEPCNYDRECKERPLFDAALGKQKLCELLERRIGTVAPSFEPSVLPSVLPSISNAPTISARRLIESDPNAESRKRPKTSKSTKVPSAMPSSIPTNAPSDSPSLVPSRMPSSSPSSLPSSEPSDSPSQTPSSEPSMEPSRNPSSEPSLLPSSSPSDAPSNEPSFQPSVSQIPSAAPTSAPSREPSFIPSVSQMPSLEPTPQRESGVCQNKVCVAEDLEVSFCSPKNDIYPTSAPEVTSSPAPTAYCDKSSITASFWGSYGNGADDGTYDQDYTGGVVVGPSKTITMFGNAWKAYKLNEPYHLTELSKLEFDFYMFKEAEGHAICVDDDINEDTFGGERIRCFMLGGSQFDSWDHVIKLDVSDRTQILQGQIVNRYDICKAEERITIDLKDLFLDQLNTINYIAFIQDNDESPTIGESAFENIVLYEGSVDASPQVLEEWIDNTKTNDCYDHFQGGETVYQNIKWHDGTGTWVLSSSSDLPSLIHVYEAWTTPLKRICEDSSILGSALKSFETKFNDEDYLEGRRRFSISLDGTIVVAYPDHNYIHPSDNPSDNPSESPSSLPSIEPSNNPTKQPTPAPIDPPVTRRLSEVSDTMESFGSKLKIEAVQKNHDSLRRMQADGQYGDVNGTGENYGTDHYGRVVVYMTDKHKANWKTKDKFMIYGTDDDDNFGECVAISYDGQTLVIGSNGGFVYIYVRDSSNSNSNSWAFKQKIENSNSGFGKKVGVSSNGELIIIAANDKAFVYALDPASTDEAGDYILGLDGSAWGTIDEDIFDQGAAIDIINNEIIVYGKKNANEVKSLKLQLSCKDQNAIPKSDSNNPLDNIECLCKDGFVSSSSEGVKTLLENNEFCIPVMASGNINAVHDSITVKTSTQLGTNIVQSDVELWRLDPDGFENISSKISAEQFNFSDDDLELRFDQLRPGYRYKIVFLSQNFAELSKDLELVAVTSCSCQENTIDDTGRPENFSIHQSLGHVTFNFTDGSYCEDAFSFTRVDKVEEFLSDFAERADSFTSDFYFSAAEECFTSIEPGIEASDDLSLSNLVVGKRYSYCVRAIGSSHYMDAPFALSNERRLITSSLSACDSHTIAWESSIHGQITTAKNAGYLPIEDATIRWELLDKNDHTRVLDCDGCSGEEVTDDGGLFKVQIQALDDSLDNDSAIPVRLHFEKTSQGTISHDFLCNDGEIPCPSEGFVIFLNHLTFDAPLHIIDDTSIPFSGKVTIADTNGCTLSNVEVCAMYNDTSGAEEELVCVESDSEGLYSLPVVIGSTIMRLDFAYKKHNFEAKSSDKDFGSGIVISADDAPYNDYDFEDVTKTTLRVEVAGGICNKQLGTSYVQIRVAGCEWDPEWITQSGWLREHQNIPAHVMSVEVKDIRDSSGRILPVFMEFQGTNPIVRTIDLSEANDISEAMKEEEDSSPTTDTGRENTDAQEEESDELEAIEEEEKEQLDTVRFQYDGTLTMDVQIDSSKDKLTCGVDPSEYEGADSFHVIDYMTVFQVNINMKYEILENLYCDIVDDSLEVEVTSRVGYDDFDGSDEFKAKIPGDSETDIGLKKCNPLIDKEEGGGICMFEVVHDTDDENNNIGGARTDTLFLATGRPNIVDPFTKSIIFRVIGADSDVEHKAAVYIEGLYSKGPGESFALPTHSPIMILRDPPGGLSTASYENMVTTMRLTTDQNTVSLQNTLSLDIDAQVEYKSFLCKGAGYGLLGFGFSYCDNPVDVDSDVGIFGWESELGGTVYDTTNENSNSFSMTWTYTTSDSPWTAGYSSDVFVTPNLFVAVEIVEEVYWNNTSCEAIFPFPQQLVFDLNSPPSEQALSFYTRAHIAGEKIPVMEESLITQAELLTAANAGENVCCPDGDPCEPKDKQACSDEQKETIKDEKEALEDGIREWNNALDTEADKQSLTHWMTGQGYGMDDMHSDNDLKLDDKDAVHSAGLAPGHLIDEAKRLDVQLGNLTSTSDEQLKEGIRTAKRLQIAGGGSLYELKLQKERQDSTTSCQHTCSVKTSNTFKLPKLKNFLTKVFSVGVELSVDPLNLQVESEHVWHKQSSTTKATQVSVTLGDPDPGDELVVDMFYDATYGTLVFETIAGKTKCPQEINTLANENPGIEILKHPSQFVFPDNEMIFELKLSNVGEAKESLFSLYAQNLDNEANLELKVDGASFYDSRVYSNVAKSPASYTQILTIKRGQKYINKAISLSFESACLDDDSLANDLSVALWGDHPEWQSTIPNTQGVTLFNTYDEEGTPIIKFIEPCPTISWAGLLARDRKFVINTKSSEEEQKSILAISIFNANFGTSALKEMKEDRLENVYLSYRKLGEGEGDWEPALIDLDTGKEHLDFVGDYAEEDNYGYTTLEWFHGGKEGNFEIKVETSCNALGGPDDIDSYRESVLSGVIDVSPPEQFGEALPLKNEILLGEEVAIAFTEDIDCSRPFSFEIEVDVLETNYRFDNDNLHIICEGRKISFNLDPTQVLDPSDLLGKTFAVTLGSVDSTISKNVKDINGNELEFNIEFQRTFAANQDLDSISTSFGLRARMLKGMNCSRDSKTSLSETMKGDVASLLDLSDISRLKVTKLSCMDGLGEVDLRMKILPESSGPKTGLYGRLLGKDSRLGQRPHEILRKFVSQSKENNMRKRRRLNSIDSFTVKDMKFHASDKDVETYKTRSENRAREKAIYDEISILHNPHMKNQENRNINSELKELKDELKREKDKEMEQLLLLEERLRKLDASNPNNMNYMFAVQGFVLLVGCAITATAMFFHMKRSKN